MPKTYTLGVLAGDGTGPEVVAEGLKVLQAVAERAGIRYDLIHYRFGGEHYLKTGEIIDNDAIRKHRGALCRCRRFLEKRNR